MPMFEWKAGGRPVWYFSLLIFLEGFPKCILRLIGAAKKGLKWLSRLFINFGRPKSAEIKNGDHGCQGHKCFLGSIDSFLDWIVFLGFLTVVPSYCLSTKCRHLRVSDPRYNEQYGNWERWKGSTVLIINYYEQHLSVNSIKNAKLGKYHMMKIYCTLNLICRWIGSIHNKVPKH